MKAYAIGHFHEVNVGPAIVQYLERIDATLAPFGGRFIVHGGGKLEVLEGNWPGNVVMIEFPDRERARAWYASEGYQQILPLRTQNARGNVILVDGVNEGHRAPDLLKKA
jgi:uncharacterized protein (DUF1330 family)